MGDFDGDQPNWRRTFVLDMFQALPHGAVETMAATFAMVIANKVYGFGAVEKVAITAASAIGFFVSLFFVPVVRRLQLSVNWAAMGVWLAGGMGFVIAGVFRESGMVFLIGSLVAMISLTVTTPLIAQLQRKLYPDSIRGTLFSIGGLVRAVVAGLFAWAAGSWLDGNDQNFTPLFFLFAGCCVCKGITVLLMDDVRLRASQKLSLLESFRHVGEDRAFRKLLISWMLLGFGNLMCMVLFVDYITNPAFGYNYGSEEAALISSTIPMAILVLLIVPWGVFFDKVPFYRLRVVVNLFFVVGILVYFLGNGFWALAIGIAFHGVGKSGGKVLWSLWVNKFAEAEHVGEYMSVHTFLTGVRGVLSPVIAFAVVGVAGPSAVQVIAVTGSVLILVASLMLLPEVRAEVRESVRMF